MTGLKAKLLETAKALQSALLDLLYPGDVCCLCCDRAIAPDAQDGLCDDCLAALDALEAQPQAIDPAPGIVRAAAAFPYTGQARRLIIRLKYEHVREAAVPLARAMAMLPGGETDVLVPVPTTKKRLRKRGYNQAQVLAALIAQETGMPVTEALVRTEERAEQVRLSGQSRRQNLQGTMTADHRVRGKRVLLIDDVYTTGSTATEAARALLAAGAVSVEVFTAAKSVYGEKPGAGQSRADRASPVTDAGE